MANRKSVGRPRKGTEIKWHDEVLILQTLIDAGWSLRRLAARYGISHVSMRNGLERVCLQTQTQMVQRKAMELLVEQQSAEASH